MPFFKFIIKDKSCRRILLASAVITIIYFILLRVLYPIGSFFWDSDPYIQAASLKLEVSYRPLGYSNCLSFFHAISHSDCIVVLAQYIANVIANLFLFFTLLYFFSLKKIYQVILFILLICNPLYVLYSNYIISDAFFCSLSVVWFTVLLWIMYRPRWIYFFIQLVLLYWLFLLRYNAIIYPFIVAVAYLLSKRSIWKKIISITITFLVIIEMINSITHKTEEATGIATFSAFGGWQLANNSMFALAHVNLDSAAFNTKTSKEICIFIKNYFDTLKTKDSFNHDTVYMDFMWHWCWYSPLIKYWHYYIPRYYAIHPPDKTTDRLITSWTATGPVYWIRRKQPQYDIAEWIVMGPIFKEFATEVIKKYPVEYLRYFIWPNIKLYFHPPVELYNYYNDNVNTLGPIETAYYNFSSNKIDQSHAGLLPILMGPWVWLFPLINILFLLLVTAYYFTHGNKNDAWFNRCLIFYLTFYLSNFLFVAFAAPIYFRYNIIIVTLSMTFIIYLWQRVFSAKKKNDFSYS